MTWASSWKQFGVFTLTLSKKDGFWMSFLDNSGIKFFQWMIYLYSSYFIFIVSSINIIFGLNHFFQLYLVSPSSCLSKKIYEVTHIPSQFIFPRRKLQLVFSCRRYYYLFALAVFFWISSNLRLALKSLLSQNPDNKVQTTPWFNCINTYPFLIEIPYIIHFRMRFTVFTPTFHWLSTTIL